MTELYDYLPLVLMGFVVSVVSGMLGIGGGILLAPLLLHAPSLLGLPEMDLRHVTGLTTVQGLVACLSGVSSHGRRGYVADRRLVRGMGAAMGAGALIGALGSASMRPGTPVLVFGAMTAVAAVLMALPHHEPSLERDCNPVPAPAHTAIMIAITVGVTGGIAGQGGSFLLIPLMLHALHLSTRMAIGTSIAVVMIASCAGLVGKVATGQVPYAEALGLAIGSAAGGWLGGGMSVRTPTRWLRVFLAIVVAVAAAKAGLDAVR